MILANSDVCSNPSLDPREVALIHCVQPPVCVSIGVAQYERSREPASGLVVWKKLTAEHVFEVLLATFQNGAAHVSES